MVVIAHNIRSLHNVGSLFRSADAFGVERIWLTGFTGTPPRKEIAKTALGSESRVPWTWTEDVFETVRTLRADGYSIIGLETGKGTLPINSFHHSGAERLALVLGSEVEGIEDPLRSSLDALVEIPMPGCKRSLNVSVAAGIALFVLSQKTA
ncbi:MAG TPA: TrmH family RNA methyltransferase [Patescibacteria group bacterium]|nr:TrmH family RNA methyltransferase [Patescibacteria group bacterium]